MTIQQFMQTSTRPRQGEIVDSSGRHLGTHRGIDRYTIGQRRGLGISAPAPLYVIALDSRRNQVIVGEEAELYRQEIDVTHIHWISGTPPSFHQSYRVKIRSTQKMQKAKLCQPGQNNDLQLLFDTPQRAITPGQFAVFYEEEEVLGSGIIEQIQHLRQESQTWREPR
ncbi:unnamed protein product, partial [Cyprideis torosa]